MRRFCTFWSLCARNAFWGNTAFANDWQWVFGIPVVSGFVGFLAANKGATDLSTGYPIADGFLTALGAFVVTWSMAFLGRLLNAPVELYHAEKKRADLGAPAQSTDLLEHQRRFVTEVINRLPQDALDLLRSIQIFGRPPHGFSDSAWQLLNKANLVVSGADGPNGFNPELRLAIEERLNEIEKLIGVPPLQIFTGAGGNFETKRTNGLHTTTHTFVVAVRNCDSRGFLSNCRLYVDIATQENEATRSYLLVDTFTLNASEERYVPIVSYNEPASMSGHKGNHICLLIPTPVGVWDAGVGWPWQMPVGAYTFTLRATSKEASPCEVTCKTWVDSAEKLHFEKA